MPNPNRAATVLISVVSRIDCPLIIIQGQLDEEWRLGKMTVGKSGARSKFAGETLLALRESGSFRPSCFGLLCACLSVTASLREIGVLFGPGFAGSGNGCQPVGS
jgi:hypothetical protein